MKRLQQQFFALLRAAMTGEAFEDSLTTDEWRQLYAMAVRQSLVGVCYRDGVDMPKEVAMRWVVDAEIIRGLNCLHNQEAARLTTLFAEQGRKSAILKGQANAQLYPNPYSRQSGDIDIWVNGGRESVISLLRKMGLMDELELSAIPMEDKASAWYHHVHLPMNENGVEVEVHFRPSLGNYNPVTNLRLQRWLEKEILALRMTEEGFYVPTVRFALVMQLSHIQRHFLGGGIGLRHVCDYFCLLKNASEEDRQEVASQLKAFGLHNTAGALMWVLYEVLKLDQGLMICEFDRRRGKWMLREIMAGGNFGKFAERQQHGAIRRIVEGKLRHLVLMRFDFWETFWGELFYLKNVMISIPMRIKYRTISLADVGKKR